MILQKSKFQRIFDKSDIQFLLFNYAGVSLNIISGIYLARSIGAIQRGELAYCMNFIAMANYASTFNLSIGMSSSLRKPKTNDKDHLRNLKIITNKKKLFSFTLFTGIIVTSIVFLLSLKSVELNTEIANSWYLIAIMPSCITAFNSIVEGVMRVEGDTSFFRITRFIGLGAPSFFIILILILDKKETEFLILSNAFGLSVITLFAFIKFKRVRIEKELSIKQIYRYALRGFPYNILEFLGPWALYLVILRTDGKAALGNFAIAMSFYGLSESIFVNLEAKNHSILGTKDRNLINKQRLIFQKNIKTMAIIKSIFIPFSLIIPFVYGYEFRKASYYAIILLIIGIPASYNRYVNTITASRDQIFIPAFGQLIYLAILMLFGLAIPPHIPNYSWVLPVGLASLSSFVYSFCYINKKILFPKSN